MIPTLMLTFSLPAATFDAPAAGTAALRNAGFESPEPLSGWQPHVIKDSGEPVVRADPGTAREGRQALLVSADEPADIAVAQDLRLPPGTLWRARCWIRTAELTARDPTDVGGCLHVQTAAGGTLGRSDSRFGTSDWRDASAVFRVPADGGCRIALFFVGYGRGTGRAWFDDVRLEPLAEPAPPEIAIRHAARGPAPIDVKQGGQFIEPLCDMIPAMIAQQVAGDSFEEEPPWKVSFRPQCDRPYRPWYPSGAVHLAEYTLDSDQAFHGQRCQKIELPAAHARAGISQDGFYTRAGVSYRLRLHLRGRGGPRVSAALHGDGGPIAGPVELGTAADDWQPAEVLLAASRASDHATLTIELAGPGTIWLDRVSLIGEDAVLGIWRPDIVAALPDMNPGIIRFGGSTLEVEGEGVHEFNWQECIGPRDRRPSYPVACWGGLDANFASLEEIVQLCRHIGAEPLLCVRWTGRTPADAAAQVEYFNGAADSPMGRRRAANGHPEPYAVRFWQVGNEVGGEAYCATLADFARAMKQADPTIRIISSWGRPDLRRFGGGLVDYVSDHHYGCDDMLGMQAGFDAMRAMARDVAQAAGAASTRATTQPIRAAITEWNTSAARWGLGRRSLETLANALACARYHNLLQANADLVEITNRSNLADSFCSGVLQTGSGWLYCTPTYYAQQLYARAAGSWPVVLQPETADPEVGRYSAKADAGVGRYGATADTGVGRYRPAADVPWPHQEPDIAATISADGRTLRIYAVNATPRVIEVPFTVDAEVQRGTVHVLRDRDGAPTAEVINTRDDPRRIVTTSRPLELRGQRFRWTFEPFSLTLLELELGM